jgi:hypothetical protein
LEKRNTVTLPQLSADCSRCLGLCCRHLAIDRSPSFGFDKPAGVACPNLSTDHRCTIHARRVELGFSGCVGYDCAGAGQHATALFSDYELSLDAGTTRELGDAFVQLREVHELLVLLQATGGLQLDTEQADERIVLLRLLCPACGWTRQSLTQFDLSDAKARVYRFLRGLRSPAHALRLKTVASRGCQNPIEGRSSPR